MLPINKIIPHYDYSFCDCIYNVNNTDDKEMFLLINGVCTYNDIL